MSGREHGHDHAPPHAAPAAAPEPRATDHLEVVPGFERENLQGWIPELASAADVRAVVEKAFDYRGDVTITRRSKDKNKDKDGPNITGYLFDRRIGPTLATSVVRVMLATGNQRLAIPYSEIASIAFTGRDTAAGKSYEAWVRKYWEKRAQGERNISLEPEALE